jgi:hypothetical protein
MTRQRMHVFLVAAGLFALPIQPVVCADSGPEAARAPGEVNFAISCGPDAQNSFKQGVWTLHSFWYPEALKAFTAITVAEPGCAMGYWGIAMSHWYPLWYPPSPAALRAGSDAVEKAIAAGPKTEREKDYVAAIATFYRDSDKLDHQTRTIAYEKAMEQVYLRYPQDREAAVFYGLALNASALPTDKTYANKQKAALILNKVWAEQPNHPGVVHYLIHSDDTAQFAQAGLDAAICYSKIAPDVPHALHMPSHIFTRLGLWQQSIDSNRTAHAAALAYVRQTFGPDGFDNETVHTMDYLEYAYLQTSQDQEAKSARTSRLACRCRSRDPDGRVSARTLPLGRGDDLVCSRARHGTDGGHSRRPGGNRQAAIAERQVAGSKGHLLGKPGRGRASGGYWRLCPHPR